MRLLPRFIGTCMLLALPSLAMAAGQTFTDLPTTSPHFTAAEYLKEQGILEGYEDGTFRPGQLVNRAEVIKLIVLQKISIGNASASGTTSFRDVPADAWFSPYVEKAYNELRIIDGPPKTYTFDPSRPVTRAEFLKMLLLAYDVDPLSSYGEISFPIAEDAADNTQWFYPYLRYALTASMLAPEDNALQPGENISRANIADMLYRFLLYREGKRTQTLLSITENETLNALRLTQSNALPAAEHAAARALLSSRGALASQPNDANVKASVKTAEGVMAVVRAANALAQKDVQKTLDGSSTAWHLGEKAKSFSSALEALAGQIQSAAAGIADRARSTK